MIQRIIIYGIIIILFYFVLTNSHIPYFPSTFINQRNIVANGGIGPNGIRPTFTIPAETSIGYWGYTPMYNRNVPLDIYDYSTQGKEYIVDVGHWNNIINS